MIEKGCTVTPAVTFLGHTVGVILYLEVGSGLQMEREAKKICHRRDKIVEILTAENDLLFPP